jgi:8-oxo-dGTP pyrophosphatase MutT (NUDIX family)
MTTPSGEAATSPHWRATLLHPVVSRLAQQLSARVPHEADDPQARRAAVAAVLRVRDEPELLFIKRAVVAGDPWSGHIAFPGGRHDASDLSLVHTAIRETREETAVDLDAAGQMLGRLDDLAPRSPTLPRLIIRPFVALVRPDAVVIANHEVAAHFWVPLDALRRPEAQAEHVLVHEGQRLRFPGVLVGGHVTWGLTERILRQLLHLSALE